MTLGALQLLSPPADAQVRRVAAVTRHPAYHDGDVAEGEGDIAGDLALARLDPPATPTRLVRPICLPGPDVRFPPGTNCTVTGWGDIRTAGQRRPGTPSSPGAGVVGVVGDTTQRVWWLWEHLWRLGTLLSLGLVALRAPLVVGSRLGTLSSSCLVALGASLVVGDTYHWFWWHLRAPVVVGDTVVTRLGGSRKSCGGQGLLSPGLVALGPSLVVGGHCCHGVWWHREHLWGGSGDTLRPPLSPWCPRRSPAAPQDAAAVGGAAPQPPALPLPLREDEGHRGPGDTRPRHPLRRLPPGTARRLPGGCHLPLVTSRSFCVPQVPPPSPTSLLVPTVPQGPSWLPPSLPPPCHPHPCPPMSLFILPCVPSCPQCPSSSPPCPPMALSVRLLPPPCPSVSPMSLFVPNMSLFIPSVPSPVPSSSPSLSPPCPIMSLYVPNVPLCSLHVSPPPSTTASPSCHPRPRPSTWFFVPPSPPCPLTSPPRPRRVTRGVPSPAWWGTRGCWRGW